jgi:hypothetical protein
LKISKKIIATAIILFAINANAAMPALLKAPWTFIHSAVTSDANAESTQEITPSANGISQYVIQGDWKRDQGSVLALSQLQSKVSDAVKKFTPEASIETNALNVLAPESVQSHAITEMDLQSCFEPLLETVSILKSVENNTTQKLHLCLTQTPTGVKAAIYSNDPSHNSRTSIFSRGDKNLPGFWNNQDAQTQDLVKEVKAILESTLQSASVQLARIAK